MSRAAIGFVLCALALAGCGANGAATLPSNQYCTPPECALAPLTLAAAVTPPDGTGVAPVEIGALVPDPVSGDLAIVLPAAVHLSGKVTQGGRPLAGAVVASRPSRIPGGDTRTFQAQIDPVMGTYDLAVTPTLTGETYTLRVVSSQASDYPPQTFTVDATSDTRFDLVLDDPSQLTQLHGTVADPVGTGIAGMSVQAIDPLTQALVSTTAMTDGTGAYAIRLSRALPGPMVRLTATPTMTAPAGTPTLTTVVDVSKPGPTNSITADLTAPPLPATVRLTYRVSGMSTSGADTPVVGAQCQFHADVTAAGSTVTATHDVSGMTGSDGTVTVDLIPAASGTRPYALTVAPPSTSDFQTTQLSLPVGTASGVGAPVMLALRPELSGRVLDPSGAPLAQVGVQTGAATLGQVTMASSLAEIVQSASADTTDDGRFVLRVDPAPTPDDPSPYDIGFEPPASSMLPRLWMDGVMVVSDVDLGNVRLPRGARVTARVSGPDGAPVAGAQVEVYMLSQQSCAGQGAGCLALPHLLARISTGDDGSGPLLLPAQ